MLFVDLDDDGCHFEAMLKDAVLLDYDPMSDDIAPSCLKCDDGSCTYHPSNHAMVMSCKRPSPSIDAPFISA